MMRLIRTQFYHDGIIGTLLNEDGDPVAVTMEHSYAGRPKLSAGTYRCQRGMHRLEHSPAPFATFEIMEVPGHTGILFHPGNWHEDSNGCVLLGRVCTGSDKGCMITNSRATFNRFMLDLDGVESFSLMVTDGVGT